MAGSGHLSNFIVIRLGQLRDGTLTPESALELADHYEKQGATNAHLLRDAAELLVKK